MDNDTLQKIRSINSEFYQTFAGSFADTRGRLQPGVQRLLSSISRSERVLDLGCGNGALAAVLNESDFKGRYLGLDISEQMLAIANAAVPENERFDFILGELAAENLHATIQEKAGDLFHPPYDQLVALAILHHIPGSVQRADLARELHGLLAQGGSLVLSVWNFMDSERLRARVLPWEDVGLSVEQVEDDDYLIDWRRDGQGIRYVHNFSEDELNALADHAGFRIDETFYSDGETGTLGRYQIWAA